ncbi:methylated-DNA--[protein]-cysteine S-methyltransferase [bacterium 210820-DFI.6.37]|nr:methylated-DNA--[protein]-cysteine S-methyltransferase [bacterium 210820-DFI.6.37]
MQYIQYYESPLGKILLGADDQGLTGLWLEGQKYFANYLDPEHEEKECEAFEKTRTWLDLYFRGEKPGFLPPIHMIGTAFQKRVWEILLDIPYGEITTYGKIASQIAEKMGLAHMSPQAVGGAVGHNEISIIIPCHRVVGSSGSLTGYAGGIDKKIYLLTLEGVDMSGLFRPTKGTAL